MSDGLHNIGVPNWELVLALFAAWVLVFLCLIRGIKSAGKVVYFTATFPYLILLILLIRGVTLDGAGDGVTYYMVPEIAKLSEAKIWGDAAMQIFFSLSLGNGGLATLASYNEFHNNIFRDTLIVVFGNCGTSIFAGFAVFPILGFVAKKLKTSVAKIAASGPSLVFVAYPGALTRLPFAPFWSILFFFMLIILGIDSEMVMIENVVTCIIDQWPHLRHWKKKMAVVGSVCAISFLFGLVLTCPGGPYVLNLIDTFAGGWPLVMTGLFEVCMVSYVYGWKHFIKDIGLMLGIAPNLCWKIVGYPVNLFWHANWLVITPLLLVLVLIFNWATFRPTTFGPYKYPLWGDTIGWGLAIVCVMWIPIVAVTMIVKVRVEKKRWIWLIKPSEKWRPTDFSEREQLNRESALGPSASAQVDPAASQNSNEPVVNPNANESPDAGLTRL